MLAAVQADGQRFGGASCPAGVDRGAEQVGGEDRRLAGFAGGLVEDFQGGDHSPAGIVLEGVEVSAALVRVALLPGLCVPLLGQLRGHLAGVGPARFPFLLAPLGLKLGDFAVVDVLGDVGGDDPGEPVERAVDADVTVIEVVQVAAHLVAFGDAATVALGGDKRVGGIAEVDELAGLCFAGPGDPAGLPGVSGPLLEATLLGVVAQGVQRGLFTVVCGGEQTGVEGALGDGGQRFRRCRQAPSVGDRSGDDGFEQFAHLLGQFSAGPAGDNKVGAAVETVPHGNLAEHVAGMGLEVGVDVEAFLADLHRCRLQPDRLVLRGARLSAPAQDEQIGDRLGARNAREGLGGQSQGGNEVGTLRHLYAGLVGDGVEGPSAGKDGDDAARCGQGERLEDERVVDRVLPGRVIGGIMHHVTAERDVADCGGEGPLRYTRLLEPLISDLC